MSCWDHLSIQVLAISFQLLGPSVLLLLAQKINPEVLKFALPVDLGLTPHPMA